MTKDRMFIMKTNLQSMAQAIKSGNDLTVPTLEMLCDYMIQTIEHLEGDIEQ